jgi:acetyltransferase-like isoleucine patch superfamily enzyme
MRIIVAILIGSIPSNQLKIILYKALLHYDIEANCKIGFSLVLCKQMRMAGGARIGHFNLIYNVENLVLDKDSCINDRNIIKYARSFYLDHGSVIRNANTLVRDPLGTDKGDFQLGEYSLITAKHLFDLTDDITIGDNTVIGGIGSQFWTHGFDIYRNGIQAPIIIKNNCYVAASCLISLGVTIESKNQIGLGTVVTKSITSSNGFWISNQLVRKKECVDISEIDGYVLDQKYPNNRFYHKNTH